MQRRIQARAPALYPLAGIVLGLVVAAHLHPPPALLLAGALAATMLALKLCTAFPRRFTVAWALAYIAAATLAAWTYGIIRLPETPPPEQLALPERETTLEFQVQRIFQEKDSFGRTSGIARLIADPEIGPLRKGRKLYFSVKYDALPHGPPRPGIELEATGVLYPVPAPDPGRSKAGLDAFNAYLKETGTHYRFARCSELRVIRPPSLFQRFCGRMNRRFHDTLRLGAPADKDLDNIYVAMLLGRKNSLTSEQKERFQLSGTMHFFAISGLHIGVIAAVIAQALLLLRVPRAISPFIGLPLLFAYVVITGSSPSAIRAFLMATFFWAAYALKRQRGPLPALAGSAVFVLLIAPEQLRSIGFQLSYAVVLSILLLGLPLYEVLTERFRPGQWTPEKDRSKLQRCQAWSVDKLLLLFAISFSAWVASTPLSAGLFNYVAPGAALLNMALINLAGLTIITGVSGLAVGTVFLGPLAAFLNHAAWVLIIVMDAVISFSTQLPGAIIRSENFPLSLSYASLTLYFALLFGLHVSSKPFTVARLCIAPAIILALTAAGLLTTEASSL
ncbi:MAG: ComEC/Rec2 family competence protein [Opitutales bacterium]